jgi:hypothetical protein
MSGHFGEDFRNEEYPSSDAEEEDSDEDARKPAAKSIPRQQQREEKRNILHPTLRKRTATKIHFDMRSMCGK